MTTTNKALNQPANGSANWDVPLNANFGVIDAALGSFTVFNITGVGTSPVTLSTSQYQSMGIKFTGTPGNNVTYQIPSGVGGTWLINNASSGSYTVTISSLSGGTSVSLTSGSRKFVTCDPTTGVFISSNDQVAGPSGSVQYNNSGTLAGSANLTFDGLELAATDRNISIKSTGRFEALNNAGYWCANASGTQAPAVFFDSSNNLGLGSTTVAGGIKFYANGAERLTLTSAGNFGIGTNTPGAKLEIASGSVLIGNSYAYYGKSTGGTAYNIGYIDSSNNLVIGDSSNASNILFYNNGANSLILDLNANACIGVGNQNSSGIFNAVATKGYFTRSGYSGGFNGSTFNIQDTGSSLVVWVNDTSAGTIGTFSDYRMKKNVSPISSGALARVMQMNPVNFEFSANEGKVREGFIAHELQAIVPSAVSGEKDGLTVNGDMQPQTLEWAPVVAVLAKALQELKAEFDDYKSKHP